VGHIRQLSQHFLKKVMPQLIFSGPVAPGRAAVRCRCTPSPVVRIVARLGSTAYTALVREISETGIWLLVGQRWEPGASLAIRPGRLHQADSRALTAQVACGAQQADGSWLLACRLSRRVSKEEVLTWFRAAC
jgi:hypothetical protein